ncbi:MAG: phosphoribosylaminoimidazolesuccinocarboxamide synthase [Candidatus Omnitrophica bacterium]|nr:phosphoribosylaminoimidazolesuccinocarboxamide synthase [Candidatus Omnitrophota bacterium]
MERAGVLRTEFKDLKFFKRGKVRDVYDLGDRLLIISTDRISCFDVILPNVIPNKGKVLTALSCFWFDFIKDITSHHFITSDINSYPEELKKYSQELSGRSMIVSKTRPIPIECVVRGYLSGSGWKEYKRSGSVCGIKLPGGLKQSDKLPEAIFTPSTKAEEGHDLNVDQDFIEKQIGKETADRITKLSKDIYSKASDYAASRGIIIADTKFEFGVLGDKIIIIDEVLTPDSSRFWPKDEYSPGKPQPSFDKQFVRDYLETLDWDKTPPAPELPEEIIQKTSVKYLEAYKKITGKKLS